MGEVLARTKCQTFFLADCAVRFLTAEHDRRFSKIICRRYSSWMAHSTNLDSVRLVKSGDGYTRGMPDNGDERERDSFVAGQRSHAVLFVSEGLWSG